MKSRVPGAAVVLLALCVINSTAAIFYVDQNSTNPAPPYTNWSTAAAIIQVAIDSASSGDTVLVNDGLYATGGALGRGAGLTNRVSLTKAITLRSVNGPAATIIRGNQIPGSRNGPGAVRCAYLTNGASIIGFTLTNGATLGATGEAKTTQNGGGAFCEFYTACVISNCVFAGNSAFGWGGGAIYATANNCIFSKNSAISGGGAYLCPMNNCLVISNAASSNGGGTVRGTLRNCTFIGNRAATGGGVDGSSDGVLRNCIVYYNSAPIGSNYYQGTEINNCCTVPLPPVSLGFANFTSAPVCVDLAARNFRLQTNSPCINAGNNGYAFGARDLDHRARTVGATVDVGAYEFQSPGAGEFIGWLEQHGVSTDGSADFVDADGDGMSNWQEWISGTDPLSGSSVLKMLTTTEIAAGLAIQWQSVSNRSYYIQRSFNSLQKSAFSAIESNVPGQTGATSFLDTNINGSGPYFYRVGVER